MIGEIAKLMASIGNWYSTKRINEQERELRGDFYSQQQARLSNQRNRNAMDDTEARVAMGSIDKSEARAQERDRNMRGVTGGTDMTTYRTKQAASDARAEVAGAIHARKQRDRQVYDEMSENSRAEQYKEEQARLNAERASVQNMYQNAMYAAGAVAGGLGDLLGGGGADNVSPGEVVDKNIGKDRYNGNGTRGGSAGKWNEKSTGGTLDEDENPTAIKSTISSNPTPVVADTSGLRFKNNPYYGMSSLKARMLAKRAASK